MGILSASMDIDILLRKTILFCISRIPTMGATGCASSTSSGMMTRNCGKSKIFIPIITSNTQYRWPAIRIGYFGGWEDSAFNPPITPITQIEINDTLPVICALTLGELLYISFRIGQPGRGKKLVDSIDNSARVMPVDRPIVEKAASLKAGQGIPFIDSIILSTFMLAGCREIHTTDRNHFAEIKNKGISFVFY